METGDIVLVLSVLVAIKQGKRIAK